MSSRCLFLALVVLVGILLVHHPVLAAQSSEQSVSDSLTRGSRFTAAITGLPNTSYYIWLPRTFTMTGLPYDQPPVIADYTLNIRKDPPGGPYIIGSYEYNNGNGQTIRDDVCPSSAEMSNINYYALVTTDRDGLAVVEFQTSAYTGLRSYSVRVENPDSIDRDRLMVGITVFSRKAPVPAIPTPEPKEEPTRITQEITVATTMPTTDYTPVPIRTTQSPAVPTQKAATGLLPLTCAILITILCTRINRE